MKWVLGGCQVDRRVTAREVVAWPTSSPSWFRACASAKAIRVPGAGYGSIAHQAAPAANMVAPAPITMPEPLRELTKGSHSQAL